MRCFIINNYKHELDKLYEQMAEAYFNYVLPLKCVNNIILEKGLSEGINKFLSNAYINSFELIEEYSRGYSKKKKWLVTHYFTKDAMEKITKNDFEGLQFEHIIPKNIYQNAIFKKMKNNSLNVDYVKYLLKECWILATVTKDEHTTLHKIEDKKLTLDDYLNNKLIRYKNAQLYNENDASKNKLLENRLLGKKIRIIV